MRSGAVGQVGDMDFDPFQRASVLLLMGLTALVALDIMDFWGILEHACII